MRKQDVAVIVEDGRIRVLTPHPNQNFNSTVKKMGGRWFAERGWVVDAQNETLVRAALKRCYSTDGTVEPDVRSVVITVRREVSRGPVVIGGRVLARAFDRDGGAKLGPGVVLLDGDICSGGSRAYWSTTVDAKFLLHDVPAKIAQKMLDLDYEGLSEAALYDPEVHVMAA